MNKLIGAKITSIEIVDHVFKSIKINKDGIEYTITGGSDYDDLCLTLWEDN